MYPTIESTKFTFSSSFCPSFSSLFIFLKLDLVATASTPRVVVVLTSPPFRRRLAGGEAPHRSLTVPLTVVGPDKIGPSGS
jgi:hypothetical protein